MKTFQVFRLYMTEVRRGALFFSEPRFLPLGATEAYSPEAALRSAQDAFPYLKPHLAVQEIDSRGNLIYPTETHGLDY